MKLASDMIVNSGGNFNGENFTGYNDNVNDVVLTENGLYDFIDTTMEE